MKDKMQLQIFTPQSSYYNMCYLVTLIQAGAARLPLTAIQHKDKNPKLHIITPPVL